MHLNLTTRSRIVALFLASAIPLILLSVYITLDQRTIAEARARQEIVQHAQLVAVLLNGLSVSEIATLDPLELGRGESLVVLDSKARVLLRFPSDAGQSGEPIDRTLLEESAVAGDAV